MMPIVWCGFSVLELGVDAMCEDTWRWHEGNPRGYSS
jgi:hypothetical protein